MSDEPHLAAGASSAEHLDQIGRKAGRGLTWSLVGTFVTKSGSFALGLVPTLPALVRPTIGAAIAAAVILLIDPVVNGNSFVQLSLAGGAGLIVYILVVVPLDKLRRVTALRAHFR